MQALTFNSSNGIHVVFIDSGKLYNYIFSKTKINDGLSLNCNVRQISGLDMDKAKRIAQTDLNETIDSERVIEIYPAKYNPRVHRVNCNWYTHSEEYIKQYEEKMHESALSVKILIAKLNDIFKVITPSKNNFHCYGHEIRNLLLLASMEVESSWTAILLANGYSQGNRLTTNDYVKLLDPLYLSDIVVVSNTHGSLRNMQPFLGWDSSSPTQSLLCYQAYNETKHDRENNLSKAELFHAISAVTAAIGLLYVQFGRMAPFWYQPEFSGYHVKYAPNYKPEDLYFPFGKTEWTPRNLF